jgi:uroporphyrinogen decarboxylase
MSKDELTHRERVRLALEHETTDRIPISLICSGVHQPTFGELDALLQREKGVGIAEYLRAVLDVDGVLPHYVGPPLAAGTDLWGVKRKTVDFGLGAYHDEIDQHPLGNVSSIDELTAYPWPTTDWFDYSVIGEGIKRRRAVADKCLISGWGSIFEASWYMRGFEQTLMDLVINPELLQFIFEKVTDFQVAHHEKILQAGGGEIDLIFCGDDLGTQRGLVMSLETWERNIKPHQRRLINAIHRYGATAIYHSDGAIMDVVPGLLDMGIDVLQALQFDAERMDANVLKEQYGDRLCFAGGVSVQQTLPFGTPQEVRQETLERIRVLGRGGGYILGPSHAIQAGTPAQNVLTMFETALEARPT